MSKTGNKAGAPARNLSGAQLRKIWSDIKPQVLLERLRALTPDLHWTASGHRLSARCPFHADRTPSFHIYLDRGYAKCYGCNKYISNPIKFWAELRTLTFLDAFTELKQQFGLKFPASTQSQLKSWDFNQQVKRKISAIAHEELMGAIANPQDPVYAYARPAVDWLINTRQLPTDMLHKVPMVGVLPPVAKILDELDRQAEEENGRRADEAAGGKFEKAASLAPDARAYLQNVAGWVGCVLFRLDTTPDAIGRLKLRRPGSADFVIVSDTYDEELGFFGLGWPLYDTHWGGKSADVYVVEGEFDALSAMTRQPGGPTVCLVAAGGKGTVTHIDNLRYAGFERVLLVGDAPHKKGDLLVEGWLTYVKHMRSRVFVGYDKFPAAGDPDEAVLQHGVDAVLAALLSVKDKTVFQAPQDWIFDKASPEIDALDPSDIRQRIEIGATWGRLLRNRHECDAYIAACAQAFGLPPASLKREIVAREEDEPAFILRLADVLSEIFFVVGQRASDKDRWLHLWHKEKRITVQTALADDGSIERELGTILGTNYQFFVERVGIPPFMDVSDTKKEGKYLQELDKSFRWYLRQALMVMAQDAPDFDSAPHKGQGIHVMRDEGGGPPTLYLVNGRDVYHGSYDAAGVLSWRQLDGPSHNNLVFDVGARRPEPSWLTTSVAELNKAHEIDPQSLWDRLHALIDIGWVYKNHAITTELLTAQLLTLTVSNAFRRQTMMAFHADTSSGKSRFVMGLIAGVQFPRIQMIAAAVGMNNFTTAAIRQKMNGKTQPLCLDEFEDEGANDRKSRTIAETLDMLRNSVGENNTFDMGSRGGDGKLYRLNFPVVIASITKARKVQDLNRMIPIEMERRQGRNDPVQILLDAFGQDQLTALKQELAVGMLPHVAKLQQTYAEIEKEYSKSESKPILMDTRFFESLFPALTIMKYLGKDHRKFINEFCEANKEMLSATATHTDSQAILDAVLQSPGFQQRTGSNNDRYDASLLQLLATQEGRQEINNAGRGVVYDDASQLIIVSWTAAVQTLLSRHPRYGKEMNIYNVRELANRHPMALKPDELARSGALQRHKSVGLAGVPITSITAYSVSHILKSMGGTPSIQASLGPVVAPQIEEEENDNGEYSA